MAQLGQQAAAAAVAVAQGFDHLVAASAALSALCVVVVSAQVVAVGHGLALLWHSAQAAVLVAALVSSGHLVVAAAPRLRSPAAVMAGPSSAVCFAPAAQGLGLLLLWWLTHLL